MEKSTNKELLTLEEAAEKLSHDPRSIRRHGEDSLLPVVESDGDTLLFDEQAVAKKLGLENLEEPLLSLEVAAQKTGMTKSAINNALRGEFRMDHYKIGSGKGMKILVKESDVRDFFTTKIIFSSHNTNMKDKYYYTVELMRHILEVFKESFASDERLYQVLERVMVHDDKIHDIAQDIQRQPERVRQLFTRAKRMMIQKVRKVAPLAESAQAAQTRNQQLSKEVAMLRAERDSLLSENNRFRDKLSLQQRTATTTSGEAVPLLSIADMGLSVRAYNCLAANGVRTLHQLIDTPLHEMQRWRNFGKKTQKELEEVVMKHGFKLQ